MANKYLITDNFEDTLIVKKKLISKVLSSQSTWPDEKNILYGLIYKTVP